MKETENLILASASPRRVELLRKLDLNFSVEPSHVDESIAADTTPRLAVLEIAHRKALAIFEKKTSASTIVLGADTTVVLGSAMLGKPESEANAFDMLKSLSGKEHEVLTGVVVLLKKNGKTLCYQDVAQSTVKFRQLQDKEIWFYVNTREPMDKAGAYALQGLGAAFVEKIEGCYTNIIGLPIPMTISLLRKSGISVLNCL